jgi:hypothetical protein
MAALLPYVEKGGVAAISFEELGTEEGETLLSALTTERHSLAVAAIAGLFVNPTDEVLKSLRARLTDRWKFEVGRSNTTSWERKAVEVDVDRAMELVTTLHRLKPQLRALALKGLVKDPPQLESFELTASVAACVPFNQDNLGAVFQTWQRRDPGGALRAMVDVAATAGGSDEVSAFLKEGLLQKKLTLGDVRYALADGRSAAYSGDAQKEVSRAFQTLRDADLITLETSVSDLKEAVLRNSQGLVGADELVRTALASLYKQDLEKVAPLGEVELSGSAFVDSGPISQPLDVKPSFDLNGLERSEPKLFRMLPTVKARVQFKHPGADADTLVQAALRQLLDAQPNIDPAVQQELVEHLHSWAVDRAALVRPTQ